MADTDANVPETVASEPLKNDASPATVPKTDNSNAELEQLRKEKDQAIMDANLFRKKLAEKDAAESAAQAKKLEEDGQYKELLDKERAEKNALIAEKDANERNAILTKGTDEVLGKYSPAVVEIARTAGLSLVDDSEDAKASLIEKLDSINAKVGGQTRVQGNNPAPVNSPERSNGELVDAMRNPDLRPRERDAVGMQYIGGLESVKAMKQQAGYQPPVQ